MKKNISKIIMVIILLAFAIPNIKYIIEVNGKIECFGASMIFETIMNKGQAKINFILYFTFILGLIFTYLIIIINESKDSNEKEIKKVFIFISIVSVISSLILPNNSTDVYYYGAVGRLDSKYGINMYEENFNEFQEKYIDDETIKASPAIEHKFIYGPLWSMICKVIGRVDTNSSLGK